MSQKRILMIGTYPIREPLHGGQKRVSAILQAYKHAGLDARYVAIFNRQNGESYWPSDIPVGRNTEQQIAASPLTGDIICGKAIFDDELVKKKITKIIKKFSPHIIECEHEYPYFGLRKLLKELNFNPKLILSSQNIEGKMKRDILTSFGVHKSEAESAKKQIHNIEKEFASKADLVSACTKSDMDVYKKYKPKSIVLAPNGISRPQHNAAQTAYWRAEFIKNGINKVAVFVGSAHLPNYDGFMNMVSKGLGFLPLGTNIVIAGGITDVIASKIYNEKPLFPEDSTFWIQAYPAGRLSEKRLQGLLGIADVIILPITTGGGSNLKTAEALISGKTIVATNHAFRSFERFKKLPNVFIEDDPNRFRQAITSALESRSGNLGTLRKHPEINDVLWENCLKDLVRKVKEL